MTIHVKLEPSEEYRWEKYTPEDFGMTEEEWIALPLAKKEELLEASVDGHPEPPYWVVSGFQEK